MFVVAVVAVVVVMEVMEVVGETLGCFAVRIARFP